jgi:hypothetical protein
MSCIFDEVSAVSKMKSTASACFLGRSVEKQWILPGCCKSVTGTLRKLRNETAAGVAAS